MYSRNLISIHVCEKKKMNSQIIMKLMVLEFFSASIQELPNEIKQNLVGKLYVYALKNVKYFLYGSGSILRLVMCITRIGMYKNVIWCLYKAMCGPAGFSFRL